ncbi:chemotaxis protein [Oxalobacteraceae bacterium CAVE-383]|nr:chemotaxis protein [Oxalobacteraceae bacterium CAVE-383]
MVIAPVLFEFKRLLLDVAGGSGLQLTEVETDLVQTNLLLNEAITKLSSSFFDLHKAVAAQQTIVAMIVAQQTAATPLQVEELKQSQQAIDTHVNSAVTGLQFQDMTSQLIERTLKRVVGLRDVLSFLSSNSWDAAPDTDLEEMHAMLQTINQTMETRLINLENGLWKAVRQTHMSSGDIDLF